MSDKYGIPNANGAWVNTLRALLDHVLITTVEGALGKTVTSYEILNHTLTMNMKNPCITITSRELPLKYAAQEALFILNGSNSLHFNPIITRTLNKWSDDGIYVRHAYGPKFIDQMPYVLDVFKKDLHTRRAVISIWRESPSSSKDTTCLVSLQFVIRARIINCIANMRSSDAWLGLPNDITVFSYITEAIRLRLNEYLKKDIKLGTLYCNAGTRHLYAQDVDKVKHVLDNTESTPAPVLEAPDYMTLLKWLGNMG